LSPADFNLHVIADFLSRRQLRFATEIEGNHSAGTSSSRPRQDPAGGPLLGETSEQGYPACDFTLARIANESSKE